MCKVKYPKYATRNMSCRNRIIINLWIIDDRKKENKREEECTFIRGRFSALSFRTSYRIRFENSLFCLFSLYLKTLASLCSLLHPSLPNSSTLKLLTLPVSSGTQNKFPLLPQASNSICCNPKYTHIIIAEIQYLWNSTISS